jgi:3-oxoacyl-[acyl-carrier-protein] synthase II
LALRDQKLPPTINLENQDERTIGMDFVPNQSRATTMDYALSNSFGFGGTNGSLIFKRWSE